MRPDKATGPSAHIIISRFFLLFSRPFQQLRQTTDHKTDHGHRPIELTVRGLVLGVAITLVFTAANVYLGLKVGLTFASSIPAAVVSMAVLRVVKSSTIEENNIVQTVASAAGTLSSIIFVLPGLVMVGWWNHFPFWSSFGICATGGVLGVMFTIPLRRAMVVDSLLPYPEGVAAAEVLKLGTGNRTGSAKETKAGFFFVIGGSLVSFGFALLAAMRLLASEAVVFFRVGPAATGCGTSLSLALFGRAFGWPLCWVSDPCWPGRRLGIRYSHSHGSSSVIRFGRRGRRLDLAYPSSIHRRRDDWNRCHLDFDKTG